MLQPDLRPIGKGKYKLQDEWTYTWTKYDITRRIVIPKYFECDGASVPRLLWTFTGITPDGLIRSAATLHDFIYRYGGKLPKGSYQQLTLDKWIPLDDIWTRKNADRLFARVMREAGVSKSKRRLAYRGVRLFGWRFFGKFN